VRSSKSLRSPIHRTGAHKLSPSPTHTSGPFLGHGEGILPKGRHPDTLDLGAKADEIIEASAGPQKMTPDAVSVVVVVLFELFAGTVAYIIRPRNRRKSRRRVALSAAADSQDPPFIERRTASRWSRLKDFFSRRRQ
jgi:hypothetical protein